MTDDQIKKYAHDIIELLVTRPVTYYNDIIKDEELMKEIVAKYLRDHDTRRGKNN